MHTYIDHYKVLELATSPIHAVGFRVLLELEQTYNGNTVLSIQERMLVVKWKS
jgi:hypothetical protein